MRRNDYLKNSKKNKTIYIIGNGPSLNNFNFEKIYGKDVITMNYFYLHPKISNLNVVAHCLGEPYDCSTWVDPVDIVENTPAETYWFNVSASEYCIKKFTNKKLYFYLSGISETFEVLLDANLSRPSLEYKSTSQMAIMIAMHMGYKEIYLLGLDHDYLVNRGYAAHFYNEDRENLAIAKADHSDISYLNMIISMKNLFEIYEAIKKIAIKKHVKIINLSKPSYLDVFPYK